jgi:hypothetical protein
MRRGPVGKCDELRRVAIHESGHAVLAFPQGIPLGGLSIVYNPGSTGRFTPVWDKAKLSKLFDLGLNPDRQELLAGRVLIVCVGGLCAERLVGGRSKPEGASDDYEQASWIAGKVSGSDREVAARIRLAEVQAGDLIRFRYRNSIRTLAEVLVVKKELDGRALRKIVRSLCQD